MSIPVPDLYDPRIGGHLTLNGFLTIRKNVKNCQVYVKYLISESNNHVIVEVVASPMQKCPACGGWQ